MRRHHTSGLLTAVVVAICAAGCTASTDSSARPTRSPLEAVHYDGIDFDVVCRPVAEALVDIALPHRGQPKLRSIAGLWDHQAVAVLAKDPKRCGLWTLALARGLSDTTRSEIEAEAERGVEAFGVKASPVPRDEGH